jgi:hypothetical protein
MRNAFYYNGFISGLWLFVFMPIRFTRERINYLWEVTLNEYTQTRLSGRLSDADGAAPAEDPAANPDKGTTSAAAVAADAGYDAPDRGIKRFLAGGRICERDDVQGHLPSL